MEPEDPIRSFNEALEEVFLLASEQETTSSPAVFEAFVQEHLPFDMLERLSNEMGANLGEIWYERFYVPPPAEEELQPEGVCVVNQWRIDWNMCGSDQ
jgi:hypothetical protein